MAQLDLFGSDIARPFRIDGLTDVETVSGALSIKQSLENLLLTRAANSRTGEGGDRIMNRDIGLNIVKYLFISDENLARNNMKNELLKLNDLEPRIILDKAGIKIEKDPLSPHTWKITLNYRLRSTQSQENRVFPFFVKDGFVQIGREETP